MIAVRYFFPSKTVMTVMFNRVRKLRYIIALKGARLSK